MSIWLEIMCDTHPAERPHPAGEDGDYVRNRYCRSDEAENPSGHASSYLKAHAEAHAEAKRCGWIKYPNIGWRCPGCQKHQKLTMPKSSG